MDDTSVDSILIARSALHQQASIILRPNRPVCLNLLLLDRSSSMRVHGDTPLKAANECLEALPTLPGAENSLIAVFTFANHVTLDVTPRLVRQAQKLTSYRTEIGTKLYEAVYTALFLGLEFQANAQVVGTEAKIAISVITDGADSTSGRNYYDMMRRLAAEARQKGFLLQVVGIGIDAKRLAQLLGFEEGYARTVESSRAGVHEATSCSSAIFTQSQYSTVSGVHRPKRSPHKRHRAPKSGKSGSDSDPTPR